MSKEDYIFITITDFKKQISKLKPKTSILYIFHSSLYVITIHWKVRVSLSSQQQPCSSPETSALFILKISTSIPQSYLISWLLCLTGFTQSVCMDERRLPTRKIPRSLSSFLESNTTLSQTI